MSVHLELAPAVAAVASHTRAVGAHELLADGGSGAVADKHALAFVTLRIEEKFETGQGFDLYNQIDWKV